MNLPSEFQFHQGNLQDFVDCRRRFYLRYVRRLAWPALQSEPALENEERMQRGARFHRLAHQRLLELPEERLVEMIIDPELKSWWQHFTRFLHSELFNCFATRVAEVSLSTPLVAGHRLVAKLDLVAAAEDGRMVIYDWKTNRLRPRSEWLMKRLQTRLYPYVLVRAASPQFSPTTIDADRVTMVYWFAAHPTLPERIPYSAVQYQSDEAYLNELVETILHLDENEFDLAEDELQCRFCNYRSLCDRGVHAGSEAEFAEWETESLDFDLDFSQLSEIEY